MASNPREEAADHATVIQSTRYFVDLILFCLCHYAHSRLLLTMIRHTKIHLQVVADVRLKYSLLGLVGKGIRRLSKHQKQQLRVFAGKEIWFASPLERASYRPPKLVLRYQVKQPG